MPRTAAIHRDEPVRSDEGAWELAPGHETLTFTARDWEVFLADFDDIDRPRPELDAAIRRYRDRRDGSNPYAAIT